MYKIHFVKNLIAAYTLGCFFLWGGGLSQQVICNSLNTGMFFWQMITCLLPPPGGGCPAGGEGAGSVVMVKHFPRGLAEAGAAADSS